MGKSLTTPYGKEVAAKIEELIDVAEAEFDKAKKKKDAQPFDRSSCCPRLPDDVLCELVKI